LRKKSLLLFLQEKIRYFSIGKYRRRKLTIRFLDVVAANKIKLLLLAGPIVHAGRCRNEGYISTSHFTTCMQNLTHHTKFCFCTILWPLSHPRHLRPHFSTRTSSPLVYSRMADQKAATS
jgi:hypothetical protein